MAFTFFYRDRETIDLLIQNALPEIRSQRFIRIWDAGCAYGPEPYTLAMMFRESMSEYTFRNLKILATDVEEVFGQRIRRGYYSREETGRIDEKIKKKYFRKQDEGYLITDEIRSKVEFRHHDLLSLEPVRDGLSLIVCKNVLLHFPQPKRTEVINMFWRSLRDGGYLAMENTQEMPGSLSSGFVRLSCNSQIFKKITPQTAKA